MATNANLFISFYPSQSPSLTAVGTAAQEWSRVGWPLDVYHYRGVATLNKALGCTLQPGGGTFVTTYTRTMSGGQSYTGHRYGASAKYDGTTTPSYATWTGQNCFQLGIKRATHNISNEVYVTFDWHQASFPNSSITGHEPTAEYKSIFRWGDVEIRFKSTTWTGSSHTVVLAIRNNGSEIATITVPGVTNSTEQFTRIHVKLDATGGLIDCECAGNGQSVSYTGQNTVNTISLSSAAFIYVGPPIADNNATQAYPCSITNVYMSSTGYSAGRPMAAVIGITSDNTLSGWLPEGTAVSTLTNALSLATDAKAARGYGTGAYALLNLSTRSYLGDLVGLQPDILSIELHAGKVSNRDLVIAKRLSLGISLNGVATMGSYARTVYLSTDSSGTPPAGAYVNVLSEFILNPPCTTADWANIKARLETV